MAVQTTKQNRFRIIIAAIALLILVIGLLSHDLLIAGFLLFCCVAYLIVLIIGNPRLTLTEDGILKLDELTSHRSVNLRKLNRCDYSLFPGAQGHLPGLVLSDSGDGFLIIESGLWDDTKFVNDAAKQAVNLNKIKVGTFTAKKIGLK